MSSPSAPVRNPWSWVSTSYFAEGIPFALVIWVAGTMFKDLGHSDGQITLATASIGIAWSLKPFWAAFLDMYRTKKFFVLAMELLMAGLLCGIAVCLPLPNYFQITIAVLWVMAFASATQDICVDGIYITTLDEAKQAAFIGVQGVFWNVGRIFSTAAIVWIAGSLKEDRGLSATAAWGWALGFSAVTLVALAIYHWFFLPTGSVVTRPHNAAEIGRTFLDTFVDFFLKNKIVGMLLFVLFYRLGEGLLLVEGPLFLQASPDAGGIGLTLKEKGVIDGTISTGISLAAGLLGGAFMAKYGLKRNTLFFMALCLNVPHITYVVLSQLAGQGHGLSLWTVGTLVTIEKFGYSFGFVANMLYMMQQISPGKYQMTHYAFANSIMNLTLVPTQMISGPLADHFGYKTYFIIVMFAAIPSLLGAWFAPFLNRANGEPNMAPIPDGSWDRATPIGLNRIQYLLRSLVCIVPVILGTFWLSGHSSQPIFIAWLFLVLICKHFFLDIPRMKNVGFSPWLAIFYLVPGLNVLIALLLFIAPPRKPAVAAVVI